MSQQNTRNKNIKLFDKIKLQHVQTGFRLHPLQHEWRSGSYNQAVGCHKSKDQTDWFVVLKAEIEQNNRSNLSYHFQYGDKILLSNVSKKQYLHVTDQFQSELSKNMEVSLCENGEGSHACVEDQWEVVRGSASCDSYWRVGEVIRLRSVRFEGNLCSHNKKLRESGDNQVFVRAGKGSQQKLQKNQKKKSETQITVQQQWIVSQFQPFIYTANLTDKKQQKKTQQAEQIQNLKKMKNQIKRPQTEINQNSTQDLLKLGNERLVQIEDEKKKMSQCEKTGSFWERVRAFGFCCPREEEGSYRSMN